MLLKKLNNHEEILMFINEIRNLDPNISVIFTNGGCYKFACFLNEQIPNSEIHYICTEFIRHVVVKYDNKFYDINGVFDNCEDSILVTEDIYLNEGMECWGSNVNLEFSKRNSISRQQILHEMNEKRFPFYDNMGINKNDSILKLCFNQIILFIMHYVLLFIMICIISKLINDIQDAFHVFNVEHFGNNLSSLIIYSMIIVFMLLLFHYTKIIAQIIEQNKKNQNKVHAIGKAYKN